MINMTARTILIFVFVCLCTAQEQTTTDDIDYEAIFGTASSPVESVTSAPIVKLSTGIDDCECVIYYQCNNGTIITDGSTLIDIRNSECASSMQLCCFLPSINRSITEPPKSTNLGRNVVTTRDPIKVGTSPSTCGIRNTNGAAALRILDFTGLGTTQFAEFPWMVAVFRLENAVDKPTLPLYQCGGSLIHPQVVLTAAHCVAGRSKAVGKPLRIRAGEWDTQTEDEPLPYQEKNVRSTIIHPKYNPSSQYNDIALLVLESPLQRDEHIDTVCLPPQSYIATDTSDCFASGWGRDRFGKDGVYQVILKKVELPMMNHVQCENSLKKTRLSQRFFLHPSFVCAGGETGVDVCKGDGGSPLVCPIPGEIGRYHQVGVVSWGIGCGEEGVPGVYTKVSEFKNWVDDEMDKLGFETKSYKL